MKNRDEQLSAFHDGALNEEELNEFLRDLHQDPVEDAEKSFRYNLIADVIRDDVDAVSFMDISAAVHRALDRDESYAEPVVTGGQNKRGFFDLSSWIRPLSGMAIAASVAMVTVVSFRAYQTENAAPQQQLAAETQKPYIQPSEITPMNAHLAGQVQIVSVKEEQQNSALQAKQLNEYMLEHSGSAGQNSMQGMMPYVRVVSHGANSD